MSAESKPDIQLPLTYPWLHSTKSGILMLKVSSAVTITPPLSRVGIVPFALRQDSRHGPAQRLGNRGSCIPVC